MVGVAILLVLIPCLVNPCRNQRGRGGQSNQVTFQMPTYDELVANNKNLASLIQTSDQATMQITYRFWYGDYGVSNCKRKAEGVTLRGRQLIINQIRDAYAEHANKRNFRFYIHIVFEKSPQERCEFTWGVRPADL